MYRSLEKIRDLIKNVFGSVFHSYWIDDPNLIAMSELPCICICPVSTDIDIADNQRDEFTYTIDVIVIIDAKQELLKYKKEMVGTQFLTEIMEARDDDGILKSNTVLHVLRDNLNLGANWKIENVGSVDYSLRTRGSEPSQFVTKEASCRLTINEIRNR